MSTTRRFRVTVPETTHIYEVDAARFASFSEECDKVPDEGYLRWKLADDILAALEIGHFGDRDYGFMYDGGTVTGGGYIVVEDLEEEGASHDGSAGE